MNRYSLILPFYNRCRELHYTLQSLKRHYSKYSDRLEIIIVEDSKNEADLKMHYDMISILQNNKFCHYEFTTDPVVSINSCCKYNRGVGRASGNIILLSNPEIWHNHDSIEILDNQDFENNYFVFDCESIDIYEDPEKGLSHKWNQWYQHESINRLYHFYSAISKENYIKTGGFDERYRFGLAYEDDNFVRRVNQAGIKFVTVTTPVSHIEHDRSYNTPQEELDRLRAVNQKLWSSQLEENKF
jgi:hypothetical protein